MTQQLKDKLRSRTGASMLIAMLFMMFCMFIGSTVLAAASANATRVGALANQQDYLTSRSTAIMLADKLKLDTASGEFLRLKVLDIDQTVYDFEPTSGGGYLWLDRRYVRERTITFTVDTNVKPLDPLQRIQVEAAIQRYLKENPSPAGVSQTYVEIVGYTTAKLADNTADSIAAGKVALSDVNSKLWVKTTADSDVVQAVLNVEDKVAAGSEKQIPDFDLMIYCGTGDECYDISLEAGAPSPVRLRLAAFSNKTTDIQDDPEEVAAMAMPPIRDIQPRNGRYASSNFQGEVINVVSHVRYSVAIGWGDPTVEKGGGQ